MPTPSQKRARFTAYRAVKKVVIDGTPDIYVRRITNAEKAERVRITLGLASALDDNKIAERIDAMTKLDNFDMRAMACDEEGERVFGDDEDLSDLSTGICDAVREEGRKFNGFTPKDDPKKSTPSEATNGSGVNSQSPSANPT